MASPFSVFRKYQKTLMVIAGVICMFVFVIGDSLMPYLSSGDAPQGGHSPTAVAVRWDGGSLTNRELDMAVMRRRMVNAFMRGVLYGGIEASQLAGIEPRPLSVDPLIGPETPEEGVEQSIVRMKLFADAARDLGMTVSNEYIARYLDEIGRGYVSRDDMRSMMAQLQGISTELMFDAIREEMLARNYLTSYQYALETVTPEERWRDWKRVNERVVVEAAALPVESYLVDVAEPSEEELLAFFEARKQFVHGPDTRYSPELPLPVQGFRIPDKYNLKYIVANYDNVMEQIEGEITDEEIQKFYEENKDPMFIKTDTGFMDELMGMPTTDPIPATDMPVEDGEREKSEPTESEADSPDGAGPATPEDSATENENEGTVAPAENPVDSEAGDGPAPAVEEQDNSAPANEESSSLEDARNNGVFRLAAFLQEDDTAASPEDSAADTTDAESPASDATATDATNAESAPESPNIASNEGASGAESPATPEAEDSASPSTIGANASPAEDEANVAPSSDAPATEGDDKPVEYQTLDEVRDMIRRELASQKTSEQLVQLMDQIRDELSNEFNQYYGAVLNADAEGKEAPEPPPALVDLDALAQKHGLETGETGLQSILELRNTPIGQSAQVDTDESVLRLLFNGELEKYQPVLTRDLLANRYVVMKVEDVKGKIPTLDEVRDEVVRAWKLMKAAELAQKDADKKSQEAEESGLPLSEFFAENPQVEVVRTDPFSWLTGGAVSRISGQQEPLRLSEPEGIVAAGPAFMETVFDLQGNDVGAVLNHDQSIAYVVRIADRQWSLEELHQNYLAEANTWDGLNLMSRSHGQASARMLLSEILTDAGVQWERQPDQPLNGATADTEAPEESSAANG